MTKNYDINHATKTITLSKTFDKKAKNPMYPEFDELVALINRLMSHNLYHSKTKITRQFLKEVKTL